MKKYKILNLALIVVCVEITSCSSPQIDDLSLATHLSHTPENSEPLKSTTSLYDSSGYMSLLRNFSELNRFTEMIEKEIPQDFEYLKYLNKDSVLGITIDFIGTDHHNMLCQNEVYEYVTSYDYIGGEEYSGYGIASQDSFIDENKKRLKLLFNADKSTEEIRKFLSESKTAEARIIFHSDKKLIGTEPEAFYALNAYLMYNMNIMDQQSYIRINEYLLKIRSEIALGKTISFIRNNNLYTKKVVISYGALHLPMFEEIAKKINLQAHYFYPVSCH